jgi:uncharacterized protein YggE
VKIRLAPAIFVLLNVIIFIPAAPGISWAQVSGNVGFAQSGAGNKARAEQTERSKRTLTPQELPPSNTAMFVEANVLMNVKADEYVAVFGLSQEGATVEESNQRMDSAVRAFKEAVAPLGIQDRDMFVDLIAQPKIFAFDFTGDIARERLTGFELKKNVSIHYSDRDLIDRLVVAAASAGVHDLIKVDYIVNDISAVGDMLMQEAAGIIKRKAGNYERLLEIKVQPPAQIYAERSTIHYPTDMYDTYTASESESVATPNQSRYTVQRARKGRTFFFNGLDGDGFDKVVNPVITEPVVQFTLYLKVRYEVVRW